jgi:hypothetical protein
LKQKCCQLAALTATATTTAAWTSSCSWVFACTILYRKGVRILLVGAQVNASQPRAPLRQVGEITRNGSTLGGVIAIA